MTFCLMMNVSTNSFLLDIVCHHKIVLNETKFVLPFCSKLHLGQVLDNSAVIKN